MLDFFNTISAYPQDIQLFKELGLQPFKDIPTRERYFVGQINEESGSWMKIWVEGLPAQFWFAEIHSEENHQTVKLSTGSGSFSDYWNVFKEFLGDMVSVDSVEETL